MRCTEAGAHKFEGDRHTLVWDGTRMLHLDTLEGNGEAGLGHGIIRRFRVLHEHDHRLAQQEAGLRSVEHRIYAA